MQPSASGDVALESPPVCYLTRISIDTCASSVPTSHLPTVLIFPQVSYAGLTMGVVNTIMAIETEGTHRPDEGR